MLGALAGALTLGLMATGCGQIPADQAAPAPDSQVPASTFAVTLLGVDGRRADPTPSATTAAPSDKPTAKPSPTTAPAMLRRATRGRRSASSSTGCASSTGTPAASPARYGSGTVKGVKGFQEKRKLDQTGAVDKTTWTKLTSMTRKPTDDEMHNRLVPGPAILEQGDSGDRVRDLQARLKQIGWFSGNVTGSYGSMTVGCGQGLPGQAGDPGHRRGRPAHLEPADRDDPDAEQRREAQPAPRSRRRPDWTRGA